MRIILLSSYLALASSVFADVTFNLVGFPDSATNTFAVEVDNKIHPLKTSVETFPLWSVNVAGVSASNGYRYVQLDKKKKVVTREKFERRLSDENAVATLNEFFNREKTITSLPPIKQVYENVSPPPSKAFDSSQIATIHLTTDPDKFADMMSHPLDEKRKAIKAGFRFINADTIYSAQNVNLKTSGHGSRKYKKTSLSIEFDALKGDTFFDRPYIKLRAEYIDPTMIREKLYVDILNSVGVPSYDASYARVFVNGEPHGLFLMVEDIQAPFIMNKVHQGTITDEKGLGSLFKMRSGLHATMIYKGKKSDDYDRVMYENKILGQNPKNDPMKQFITFMKNIQDWNPTAAGGINYWKQRLDLDGFLRSMAVEYLTGAWDNFWWRGNNFFMYFNPERNVWQFIPTDFDNTFSVGIHADVDTTYKNYAHFRLSEKGKDNPLVTKLIYKNKDINKEFENVLLTITKGVFNNKALDARINAYVAQIEQDVAWDITIDRSNHPGIDLDWSVDKFHAAVKEPVKNVPKGLKTWIGNRAKSVPKQVKQK
ncbi:hypothetical protein BGW41_006168 [Actinomortierella wolfii]|nr:hypothetical protein BGW41_006168 [Actinomortierella wolfii]